MYRLINNSEKDAITVLAMMFASGNLPPPMVIFPYDRLKSAISASVPSERGIGKSSSGWMKAETFYEYTSIANVFNPWVTKNNIERPIVLYVDEHCSCVTLPMVEFCIKEKIELVFLFPNAMHLIQPCDKVLFKELKLKWNRKVAAWIRKKQRVIWYEDVELLLKKAFDSLDMTRLSAAGFRSCGLHPLSGDAIDYSLLRNLSADKIAKTSSEIFFIFLSWC